WILASGKCVEDTLFEYCRRQPVESLLHSWIIDLDDQEANSLFTNEEWNEIQCAVKILPEVDHTFANSMMRFSDVKTASDLRRVLKTTSFLNEDEPYDRVKHYDAEWAEIVMRKFLTYYEDPNETLQKQHHESWYDINVWSLIIDHGLCNVIGMETVRKESTNVAVATRKNRKRARTCRRKPERKKMGYRMDGIFRMYISDVEYGATEVAKKFDATKLLTDGFKLMKAMHDIFVCLSKQVHFEEKK
ncbi:12231_t:CDS:2, partial [Acaulospora colombiana]